MTNIIEITIVNGCQSEGNITKTWNGFEFVPAVCKLKGNMDQHKANAKEWIRKNWPVAYTIIFEEGYPESYNYSI